MSTPQQDYQNRVQAAVATSVREHSTFFLIEGIVLVILGVIAIVLPPIATIATTIIVGWIFLASGVMGLIMTFNARSAPGFWWSLLSGLLGVAAGIVLLIEPVGAALSLTLVLIAFFAVEGVFTILYAFEHRSQLSGRWEWMLISGIIDLILAAIIFSGLPGTAAWAIGILVGINMIFGGAALIGIALHARSAP